MTDAVVDAHLGTTLNTHKAIEEANRKIMAKKADTQTMVSCKGLFPRSFTGKDGGGKEGVDVILLVQEFGAQCIHDLVSFWHRDILFGYFMACSVLS